MASKTSTTHKYQLLSEPDASLKCLACYEVATEPWQHGKCGRLLYRECLEQYRRDKPCLNCRMEKPQYFEDNKSKAEIKTLRVKCDNVKRKCDWVGTIGTLEKHVSTCKFALLPCPKECKDDNGKVKCFMRKSLDEHVRKFCPNREYTCKYCGEKGSHVHDKTCKKKIVPCDNKDCTVTMERQTIQKRLEKCGHTVISCKYRELGCPVVMKRKDMLAHEEGADKLHLHIALNNMSKSRHHVITFKSTDEGHSPSFYTGPNGYNMNIQIFADENYDGYTSVSYDVNVLKGEYDNELAWPLVGKLTITLLNQLEDKNHHTQIVTFEKEHNLQIQDVYSCPNAIPHILLGYDPVQNTQYFESDTRDLYFRVSFEIPNDKPWLQCITKHPK